MLNEECGQILLKFDKVVSEEKIIAKVNNAEGQQVAKRLETLTWPFCHTS